MSAPKYHLFVIILFVCQACSQPHDWYATNITGKMPDLEFNLLGPDGGVFKSSSLQGSPVLLFFGFTNCPHVCPTTLTQLSVIMKKLGRQADGMKVLLVSVDPARDTPEVLKRYTAGFGPWFLGLTGSTAALETLRKKYGVYAAMESSDSMGSYNVMHTTAVFAFDDQGRIRLLISDFDDSDALVEDLKQLINQ